MRKATVALVVVVVVAVPACRLLGRAGGDAGDEAGAAPSATSTSTSTSAGEKTGTVTSVAPATEAAWGVAMDDANVYWSAATRTPAIRRRARGGGDPVTVCTLQDTDLSPQALFVDVAHVYVTAAALGLGAVFRAPKTGANQICEKVASGLGFVRRGIARLGDTVYVLGTNGKKGSTLLAIDAAGKSRSVAELAHPSDGLATDGTALFYANVADMQAPKLMKIAPTGGAPVELGKGGSGVRFAAGRVWFIGGGLWSVPSTGGAPTVIDKGAFAGAFDVAGSNVYVGIASGLSGSVRKGPSSGGDFAVIATTKGNVVDLVADARDVFITMNKEVLRIAP